MLKLIVKRLAGAVPNVIGVVIVTFLLTRALPVGLQIIAAPWREDACFRVARVLEKLGVARFVAAAGGEVGRHA